MLTIVVRTAHTSTGERNTLKSARERRVVGEMVARKGKRKTKLPETVRVIGNQMTEQL